MDKLSFTTNWNSKLLADCFTTIRLYNPKKYFKGAKFEVWLGKNQPLGVYVVHDVKKIKMSELNDWICLLDTGYDLIETKKILIKMYGDSNELIQTGDLTLSYVLLRKIK